MNTKWTAHSMIAGAGGGLVASVATCPLDVIKTKLQAQQLVQGQEGYRGILETVKAIAHTSGFRGFYRGLGPTILGYLPTWAIYFSVYDGVKSYFGETPSPLGQHLHSPHSHRGEERLYPAAQPKGYQPVVREHSWALHILSAMSAGAMSTMSTNPLWVIKTRFMTQDPSEPPYKHTWDAARTIYRTEGVHAFYRGLVPSLLGIFHVAVQFPLYERLKMFAQHKLEKRSSSDGQPLTSRTILLCSAIAKMTASVATYPHEVVRTRLQTLKRPLVVVEPSPFSLSPSPPSYTTTATAAGGATPSTVGLLQVTQQLVKAEGWASLYKGLSVNLIRTVPNSAVTMLTYELLMRYLSGERYHTRS